MNSIDKIHIKFTTVLCVLCHVIKDMLNKRKSIDDFLSFIHIRTFNETFSCVILSFGFYIVQLAEFT